MAQSRYEHTTRSYLVPIGDVNLEQRQQKRVNCDDVIIEVALRRQIKDRPEDLTVRDTLPNTDLGVAGLQNSWLVAAAAVVAAETVFTAAAIAINNVVGFYGIAPETTPVVWSFVRFAVGTAAAPTITRGLFHLEQLNSRFEPVGYFSEIPYFERTEFCRISLMARAAAAGATQVVPMLARTCEPIGTIITMPSV